MTTTPAYHPPVIDTARWLGNLGLLPFVGGALLVWVGLAPELHAFVTGAMSAYAALIVSFLGGVHWGFGFRQSAPPATVFEDGTRLPGAVPLDRIEKQLAIGSKG